MASNQNRANEDQSDASVTSPPNSTSSNHRDSIGSGTSASSTDLNENGNEKKVESLLSSESSPKSTGGRIAKVNAAVALGNLSPTSTTPIPNGDDASTSKSATITPTQDPISSTPVAAAAEPPKRKSRVLSRKTDHSVIERRRREKINERLIRLQETVPACREEATEMLASKLIKKRKRTEEEIQKEIGEKMVLEKLCIISHTFDYVEELRASVEHYKRLCACETTAPVPEPHKDQHHKFAHEHEATPQIQPTSPTGAQELVVSDPLSLPTTSSSSNVPKRKRHWGSNRPPKVENKKKGKKDGDPTMEEDEKRGKRKSALKKRSYNELEDEEEDELEVESDEDGRLGKDEDDYEPANANAEKGKRRKRNVDREYSPSEDEDTYMEGLEDSETLDGDSISERSRRQSLSSEVHRNSLESINSASNGNAIWNSVPVTTCDRMRAGWPSPEDSNERGTQIRAESGKEFNENGIEIGRGAGKMHVHDTSCLASTSSPRVHNQDASIHPSVSLSHLYSSSPLESASSSSSSRLPSIEEFRKSYRVRSSSQSSTPVQREVATMGVGNRLRTVSSNSAIPTQPLVLQASSMSTSTTFCPQHSPSVKDSQSRVQTSSHATNEDEDRLILLATICRCTREEERLAAREN